MADFGLSESMDTTKEYFRQSQDDAVKLPIKWMAPESINDGIFSERTDVVSLKLIATICIVTLVAGTHFSEIVEVAMCYLL